MREAERTPTPVSLDSRQQQFTARQGNACSMKLKELHQNSSSGAPIYRVVKIEHEHGQITGGMNWPAPGEELGVRTIILDNKTAAKRAALLSARENKANVGVGACMWWTDGSRSDNGQVGAAAVCKHSNEWRPWCNYLGTQSTEVFDTELLVIGLTLDVMIKTRRTQQRVGVKMVGVFSDSEAAVQWRTYLEPHPVGQVARQTN